MTTDIIFAPLHGWLPYLAAGWRFVNGVAEPMPGSHGAWSVCLEREARP
jgi:hypothetical protein